MNKRIRTGVFGALLATGTVVGVAQIGGVVSAAQTDDTVVVTTTEGNIDPASDDTADTTEAEREARHEARHAAREADRQAVADLLGIDVADLHEQLRSGSTLSEIATANGVEVSAVVDLIVQQKTARINQAVTDGRLTADVAAEMIDALPERVQTRVEDGRPERGEGGEHGGGHGRGRGHGRGHHDDHGAGPDDDGAAGEPVTTEAEG
jgi:hypothetical protein